MQRRFHNSKHVQFFIARAVKTSVPIAIASWFFCIRWFMTVSIVSKAQFEKRKDKTMDFKRVLRRIMSTVVSSMFECVNYFTGEHLLTFGLLKKTVSNVHKSRSNEMPANGVLYCVNDSETQMVKQKGGRVRRDLHVLAVQTFSSSSVERGWTGKACVVHGFAVRCQTLRQQCLLIPRWDKIPN